MPAARTKRGKKKATKAESPVAEPVPNDSMETEVATSTPQNVVTHVAEVVKDTVSEAVEAAEAKVANVVEAAEEFVDKMTGIDDAPAQAPPETSGDTKSSVADAAEQFVEKMTGIEEDTTQEKAAPKMTMAERKAKYEALQKKMVSISSLMHCEFY